MATDTSEKVNSILDNIKKNLISTADCESEEEPKLVSQQKKGKSKSSKILENDINDIRGKPKSGRFWKSKKER